MCAAQWFASLQPTLDAEIARGEFTPIVDWLHENIRQSASCWPTAELTQRASGGALDPVHLRQLKGRYLECETPY